MCKRTICTGIPLFLILLSVPGTAQQTSEPSTVLHSTTRLVQISVVINDKKGKPITDLKQDDFTIFDQGKPQKVTFFSASSPAPSAPPPPLAANVFTNRLELKGQDPGEVTVILFDALNSSVTDQSYVRKQILRFLQMLKPQDHVAIYALTSQLILIHEFTQDTAALVAAVSQFTPKEIAAFDASHPDNFHVPALANDPFWQRFEAHVNNANAEIADQNIINRAAATSVALRAIANHVAEIPGRKNLIWVSGGFPLSIEVGYVGAADRESRSLDPDAKSAGEALNRVNMAIYPVDIGGVTTLGFTDPSNNNPGCVDCVKEAPGFFARQNLWDSERQLAKATGGQAFYGSNDISDAIHRAFDDGRFSYTLGFYPDHGNWNGKFHEVKVTVNRDGVSLRYRKGYFATSSRPDGESVITASLQQAAVSPLEATSLGITVTGARQESQANPALSLRVNVNPQQMLLHESHGNQAGSVDLYFIQRDTGGKILSAQRQHVELNLTPQEYETLGKTGFSIDCKIAVPAQADDVRVVARDAASGSIGSVTIPIKSLPETEVVSSSITGEVLSQSEINKTSYQVQGSLAIQSIVELLNEFTVGMSKAQVCRQMVEHPAYRFSSATLCPEIDDWVTINAPQATDLPAKIGLVFRSGMVEAMWTKFPSADFEAMYGTVEKKHGRENWKQKIAAGDCGSTLLNQMTYWHTRYADIYLDMYNETENGEMMGWLSLNSPSAFAYPPQSCLQQSR